MKLNLINIIFLFFSFAIMQTPLFEKENLANQYYDSGFFDDAILLYEEILNEQINIAEADFESAEDAAEAKLQLSIESKRKESSLVAMNMENLGGGGQTSDSILANHARGTLGSLNDIENNFLSGLKKRKTAWDNLERDKHNRWYTAKSNIMGLQRSGSQSPGSKMFGIGTAAVSGYGTGRSITRQQPADPTKTA